MDKIGDKHTFPDSHGEEAMKKDSKLASCILEFR